MSDNFITVRAFSMPWQADVARAALETQGIPVSVADANTVSVNWLYSNAIGGVRVQVPAKFAEQAIEILSSQVENIDDFAEEEDDTVTCPRCGKNKTTIDRKARRWAFLSWLLAGFPLFYPSKMYLCKDCGETWKYKQSMTS